MLGAQVLIVESYGGRDEPVDTLTNNFVGVGVEPALDAVRIKEVPNEATYQVTAASLLSVHISACTSVSKNYQCLCTCFPDFANGMLSWFWHDVANLNLNPGAMAEVRLAQVEQLKLQWSQAANSVQHCCQHSI